MRVLMQNRSDAYERWGGDTTQMVKTAQYLRSLGVEVEISLESKPNLTAFDIVHIFNIQTIDSSILQINNAQKQNKPIALSTIYWDLRQMVNSADYLKFHQSQSVRTLAKISLKLAKLAVNLHRQKDKPRTKYVLDTADILLPNSKAEVEILIDVFNNVQYRDKYVVVSNGIEQIIPEKISEETKAVLSKLPEKFLLQAANFDPGKNQLNLIKALLDEPEIPIVFAGRGDTNLYGLECKKIANERGNVFFIGEICHSQMPHIYGRAKVHALVSLRESPGLATLEAAIYGANCVVGKYSPVEEYFGEDAWVCDPFDTVSINKAVLSAWNAPHLDKFKNRILKEFTWEKAAKATLEAYNLIINKEK